MPWLYTIQIEARHSSLTRARAPSAIVSLQLIKIMNAKPATQINQALKHLQKISYLG